MYFMVVLIATALKLSNCTTCCVAYMPFFIRNRLNKNSSNQLSYYVMNTVGLCCFCNFLRLREKISSKRRKINNIFILCNSFMLSFTLVFFSWAKLDYWQGIKSFVIIFLRVALLYLLRLLLMWHKRAIFFISFLSPPNKQHKLLVMSVKRLMNGNL